MLQKIISTANSKGFSVETESSPYGFYTLEKYEIAFLCNHCGEEIVLNLFDPDFNSKVENLVCESEDCNLKEDHIAWTENGQMSWCYDELQLISSIKLTTFNTLSFDNGEHLKLPDEGEKEVFVAIDPQDSNFAYAFVTYPNETDAWLSKYLLFRFKIDSWGTTTQDVYVCGRWPYYYKKLYEIILENIKTGANRNNDSVSQLFDGYIRIHHAARKNNQALWGFSTLYKTIDKLSETLSKYVDNENMETHINDRHLRKFISLHTCPVCREPYASTEHMCNHCRFPELNRQFISKDDAIYWEKHVLEPYKAVYEKKDSQPKEEPKEEIIASSTDCFNLGYLDSDSLFDPDRLWTLKKFYNSSDYSRVIVPENVQRIGSSAFAGANNLRRIDLPSGLREIGFTAFSECSKLQYIILPNTIEKIGRGAFQQTGLKAIFSEAPSKPSKWLAGWNLGCNARIYWKNEWYYDKNGNPVINKQ